MDGFARPQGAAGARPGMPRPAAGQPVRPIGPAQPRPVPQPMARPAMPVQRPQQYARPAAPEAPAPRMQPMQEAPMPKAKRRKRGGGWMVALQFVVGLLVIAGVAAAIVWLYIKYYQQ
ncbi:MAG TPA: hypothetical protein VHQ86_04165, partial [Candidatus Saccharimonadia bacterium]|nr:hypothetical protein [Candidatus Saccharimonadia bacterium]